MTNLTGEQEDDRLRTPETRSVTDGPKTAERTRVIDLPEQVVHHILVVPYRVLRQVTGGKHNDVIHTVAIVT